MEIEVHRVPVISTGHLDEATNEILRSGDIHLTYLQWDYGFLLYLCHVDEDDPKCLQDIKEWLKKHGFTNMWVRLDCDAHTHDDLPSYDW